MKTRGLPFYAAITAWIGVVVTFSLSPFFVSLLRDFLRVGCALGNAEDQLASPCPDGNAYILRAALPAAIAIATSLALAFMQVRFHRRPTLKRWYTVVGTIISIPVIFAVILTQSTVSPQMVVHRWLALALIAGGTGVLLFAAATGKYRWPSVVLSVVAAATFGTAIIVNYGTISVAVLGVLVSLVSLADRMSSRFEAHRALPPS